MARCAARLARTWRRSAKSTGSSFAGAPASPIRKRVSSTSRGLTAEAFGVASGATLKTFWQLASGAASATRTASRERQRESDREIDRERIIGASARVGIQGDGRRRAAGFVAHDEREIGQYRQAFRLRVLAGY